MASESIHDGLLISKIYVFRDQKVMLDRDLAELYGVTTKRLNQQVGRNVDRFPEDFMFRLSDEEFEDLKSRDAASAWGGRRYAPYAFTEHGVLMLSSVLTSARAIGVNIRIMRVFARMRELLMNSKDLLLKVDRIERELAAQGEDIATIYEYVKRLIEAAEPEPPAVEPEPERRRIGFRREGET